MQNKLRLIISPFTFHLSFLFFIFHLSSLCIAQQDSTISINKKIITLKEVVVRSNLNVPSFIDRVKNDTTFYKAFKNLKILGYTALNDVRLLDKKGGIKASLESKTTQHTAKGCRWMTTENQKTSGDILNRYGDWNYYTMQLYSGLFWVVDTVCGETNIVGDGGISLKNKSGTAKHKEQLKMLFFNPGKRIPGIPFMGDKTAIFDDEMARFYDYVIDMEQINGEWSYIFSIKAREDLTAGEKNKIVINNMTTWFDQKSMEIVKRNYDLSYSAGLYDFKVQIETELKKFGEYLVPTVLRYNGNWDVITKKRERAVFTATLFNFK
jgi:hypothetical protein